jgi:hypothetical protein
MKNKATLMLRQMNLAQEVDVTYVCDLCHTSSLFPDFSMDG